MIPQLGDPPPSPIPHDWGDSPSLDLINSRWSEHVRGQIHYDRLGLPRFRRAFLQRWRFTVANPDDPTAIVELAHLRSLLRGALERYASGEALTSANLRRLEQTINRAPVSLEVKQGRGGVAIRPQRTGNDWDIVLADIAVSAVDLMAERRIVKVCANPNCSWMFVDNSRAHARRWCNPGVCGSLVNVRRFRHPRDG